MDFRIRPNIPKIIMLVVIFAAVFFLRIYFNHKADVNVEKNNQDAQEQIDKAHTDVQDKIGSLNLSITSLPLVGSDGNKTDIVKVLGGKPTAIYFNILDEEVLKSDLPFVETLYNEYKAKGNLVVVLMNVADNKSKSEINRLATTYKLTVPIYTSGLNDKIVAKYGVTRMPSLVVADKDAKIKGLYGGGGEASDAAIRSIIEQTLK